MRILGLLLPLFAMSSVVFADCTPFYVKYYKDKKDAVGRFSIPSHKRYISFSHPDITGSIVWPYKITAGIDASHGIDDTQGPYSQVEVSNMGDRYAFRFTETDLIMFSSQAGQKNMSVTHVYKITDCPKSTNP